jgi:hypothetical protein
LGKNPREKFITNCVKISFYAEKVRYNVINTHLFSFLKQVFYSCFIAS